MTIDDNNVFVSKITKAVIFLNEKGLKLSPRNISKISRYSMYEIELNLNDIDNVISGLGLE